jgi:hypothetical protein
MGFINTFLYECVENQFEDCALWPSLF